MGGPGRAAVPGAGRPSAGAAGRLRIPAPRDGGARPDRDLAGPGVPLRPGLELRPRLGGAGPAGLVRQLGPEPVPAGRGARRPQGVRDDGGRRPRRRGPLLGHLARAEGRSVLERDAALLLRRRGAGRDRGPDRRPDQRRRAGGGALQLLGVPRDRLRPARPQPLPADPVRQGLQDHLLNRRARGPRRQGGGGALLSDQLPALLAWHRGADLPPGRPRGRARAGGVGRRHARRSDPAPLREASARRQPRLPPYAEGGQRVGALRGPAGAPQPPNRGGRRGPRSGPALDRARGALRRGEHGLVPARGVLRQRASATGVLHPLDPGQVDR